MSHDVQLSDDEHLSATQAVTIFQDVVGASTVETVCSVAGGKTFLKFVVGKDSSFYKYALSHTQKSLPEGNAFRGALGLALRKGDRFPESLEATALLTLLARSTRAVAEDPSERGFSVPYVPFQNREDHQLAQPATQVVVGRRGVGKSTLIRRALEILRRTTSVAVSVDMQAYSTLGGDTLAREILHDIAIGLAEDAARVSADMRAALPIELLAVVAKSALAESGEVGALVPQLKRAIATLTKATKSGAFVFLDDYHLIDAAEQPGILQIVHGALKGGGGWLKVAGVRSLLNYYSPSTRIGLQVPGDAQTISLDLTLENPEAAETHLRAILKQFLEAVGYQAISDVLPKEAFQRLVWANAGVPRDFLQMFARAIEHARKNRHALVTLSDVNSAIGEFGQRKIDEMSQDVRNDEDELVQMLEALERFCLDREKTNAFLLRSEESIERRLVHTLSDLRLVHLINQSTTPDKAGERYEAFIIDYSRFTGFRRRPNIQEMIPEEGQFKAAELRALPKVSSGFLERAKKEAAG